MKIQTDTPSNESVVSGALSLTVSMLAVKVLGVIYKIPLSYFLGEEGMGYFNSAYTVYSFFYLLCTAGVPKAIMILISEQKIKCHISEEKILKCALNTFMKLGVAITLLLIVFAHPLSHAIGNGKAGATMIAVAPSILFASLGGVMRGYYNANMSFAVISVSQIIEGIAKLAIGLAFAAVSVNLALPLPIVSAMTVLGVTFGALFGCLYLRMHYKTSKSDENTRQKLLIDERREIFKRIFSVSLPITLSAAVMSLGNIIDLALIMRRLLESGNSETVAVSLYGNYTTMAVPMFNLATSLISPISIAFLPVFARFHTAGQRAEEREALFSSLELSAIIAAPLCIGLITYSNQILEFLFEDTGVDVGAQLLRILAAAIPLVAMLMTVNSALEIRHGVSVTIFSMLLGCLFKLVVSFLLLGGECGIMGAPIGTVISYAVALTSSLIIAGVRYKLSLPIIKAFARPFICASVSIFVSLIPYEHINNSLGESAALFVAILFSALLYVVTLRFSGVISVKKLKEMSKYTKFA